MTVSKYRELQTLSGLIYSAMQDGVQDKFKFWNWGGTWKTQESLYRFKSRWGSIDNEYRYIFDVSRKDIFDSNPTALLNEYSFFYTVPFYMLKKI